MQIVTTTHGKSSSPNIDRNFIKDEDRVEHLYFKY